jgi:hypothetical protein
MPNGFTDEAQELLAALKHARAICGPDLRHHEEEDDLCEAIVILTQALFPKSNEESVDSAIDKIINMLFENDSR